MSFFGRRATTTQARAGTAENVTVTPAGAAAAFAAIGCPLFVNRYYKTQTSAPATYALTVGQMRFTPLIVGRAAVLDRLGVAVQTAGAAGAVVRLGIYSDLNGKPDSLVLDAGTVDTTTTGAKEITISQSVSLGRYWLAAVAQVATSTVYCHNNAQSTPQVGMNTFDTNTATWNEYQTPSVTHTGALDATAPSTQHWNQAIVFWVRAAS